MIPQQQWIEPEFISVPEELRAAVGGHPLVSETLVRRGIQTPQAARAFLEADHYQPAPLDQMPDLQVAVEIVLEAIRAGTEICVWGDFDVDGQTSTTLLVEALRELGASARYYIPDRERESHGLHLETLQTMLAEGVGLVLTCDTGVTGHEAVTYLRGRGARVVITDHHDLPPHLPDANAVVNPKRLLESHPLRELPGVGVAHLLAQGCFARSAHEFPGSRFDELAALGIVADLAVQRGDVRYLLQRGLAALQHTSRPALASLCSATGINPEQIDEEQITFSLAPRLNSLGRLDDANLAVEFLSSQDRERADQMAARLERLNTRRKFLTEQVFLAAAERIEKEGRQSSPVLIVAGRDWPRGVLGIVASRIVEAHGRPAIVLSQGSDGMLAGSARSIPGIDISSAISSAHDLLTRYGGHPMAAGMRMGPDHLQAFMRRVERFVIENYGEVQPPALRLDGYLPLSDLDLEVMRDINRLAPYGPGNPGLVFASRRHEVVGTSPFGVSGEHLKLVVADERGQDYELILWRGSSQQLPVGQVDIAYTTRINRYRGQDRLQLEWIGSRASQPEDLSLREAGVGIEIEDWRWESKPEQKLAQIRTRADLQIWCEGVRDRRVEGKSRSELEPADSLVAWSAPADRTTLLQVIGRVQPRRLYIVGIEPDTWRFEPYVRQLAGLVKYSLGSKGGRFDLLPAAEKLGSTSRTVMKGVEYLAVRGLVSLNEARNGVLDLAAGTGSLGAVEDHAEALQQLLLEAAAFRAYLKKCDLHKLLLD